MASTAPYQSNETRLALCERSPHHGGVDGAWWPRALDLRTELPDLICVLGLWIGPVRRVFYDPTAWSNAPARVLRSGALISVDPYAFVARDTIYLMGTHSRDAVLFVVAPGSVVAHARCVLRAVSAATEPLDVAMVRRLVDTCECVS